MLREIHDCHSGSNGELSSAYLKYCQFIWKTDDVYLSVKVTDDKYCTFGWVQGAIED